MGRANGSRLYSWATCSPVTTLRIAWSPVSCTRERTQGRPEVPAPAAPPASGWTSRGPLRVIPGSRRVPAGGHPALQLGHVLAHRLGQQAAEGHVVLSHLVPAGDGDRDVHVRVLHRKDRRDVVVDAAVDEGAAGQPDERLDPGHAVRAE